MASVVVDAIGALATVGTRLNQAVVHVLLAKFAHKTRHTQAPERVDLVHTGASIQARVRLAIVDVDFAVVAGISSSALARVSFLVGQCGISDAIAT